MALFFSTKAFANLHEGFLELFQCGGVPSTASAVGEPWIATKETTISHPEDDNENENPNNDEKTPELEPSFSSGSNTSSIYVVPSREALEEMVRDSEYTRRQGLFDMDRLWACGSRQAVLDEYLFEVDAQDEMKEAAERLVGASQPQSHNDLDNDSLSCAEASVFSRLAPGNQFPPPRRTKARARLPPQHPSLLTAASSSGNSEVEEEHRSGPSSSPEEQEKQHEEQEQEQQEGEEQQQEEKTEEEQQGQEPQAYGGKSYHYTIHLSPSKENFFHRPHKRHSYRTHPSLTLRRTMSESLSELPEQRQYRRRHE